jgi:alpha-N-arabinofuranosidase
MDNPVEISVHPEVRLHQVGRYLYSHFAEHLGRCIYGGIWVGEDSKIENEGGVRLDTARALKRLALPALRWPGGCFADNYHWMDGIGPREKRPKRYNLWWKQPETNQFGTDEFIRLCRMIDAEPYICLNVGSGTVEEASGWVEYCNASQPTALVNLRKANGHPEPYAVKFWGIGNENWGCGGSMRPEYYADLYRRFATYVRKAAEEGAKLIACGSHPELQDWDERFLKAMKGACPLVDSLALHAYFGQGMNDVDFSDDDYYRLIGSIKVLKRKLAQTTELAQAYSTYEHRIDVVMDEWGTWYKQATVEGGLYQQNTMRDALFAAASFHCFHEYGERLWMTNMAQTVNVLQALILTKGPEMILTPTYHIYEMFRQHRDGDLVVCKVRNSPTLSSPDAEDRDAISASTTLSADGKALFLSILNLDLAQTYTIDVNVTNAAEWKVQQVRRLATGDIRSHNTFEDPDKVRPEEVRLEGSDDLSAVRFLPQSVTTIRMERARSHGRRRNPDDG